MSDWRALVEDLAGDDPIATSLEGLDDGCFFCGAMARYADDPQGKTIYRTVIYADHEPECAWVKARRALGLPVDPRVPVS